MMTRKPPTRASLTFLFLTLLSCRCECFCLSKELAASSRALRQWQLNERRVKKNKYAKFSKTESMEKDPLESLMDEAEIKNQELKRVSKDPRHVVAQVDPNEKRQRNEILFPDNRCIDPYDPSTYGYTELGTILGAHGVKGELKVAAVTDFPERFCEPGRRHLKAPHKRAPRRIEVISGRHRLGNEYLVMIQGVTDRDEANKLRGHVLYAREEERPQNLASNEYLVNELIGLDVLMEDNWMVNDQGEDMGGDFIGTVTGILLADEMCSVPGLGQDLLELTLPEKSTETIAISETRKENVLIPMVPEIVSRVDLRQSCMFVCPPTGLLDLTYTREEKVVLRGLLPPPKGYEAD